MGRWVGASELLRLKQETRPHPQDKHGADNGRKCPPTRWDTDTFRWRLWFPAPKAILPGALGAGEPGAASHQGSSHATHRKKAQGPGQARYAEPL